MTGHNIALARMRQKPDHPGYPSERVRRWRMEAMDLAWTAASDAQNEMLMADNCRRMRDGAGRTEHELAAWRYSFDVTKKWLSGRKTPRKVKA